MTHDHYGHRDRVRQRFLREGLESFQPHEVLELLLFYALPQKDTKPLAKDLLRRFGSLHGVLEATSEELMEVPGVKQNTAVLLKLQTPLMRRYLDSRWGERPRLEGPMAAGAFCTAYFIGERYESLILICLDMSWQVLHVERLARGTINEVAIYPRLAVETALRHKAQMVILAHNHPSGSLEASRADIAMTQTIQKALNSIEVRLLDHFIVAGEDYNSLNRQMKSMEAQEDGKEAAVAEEKERLYSDPE